MLYRRLEYLTMYGGSLLVLAFEAIDFNIINQVLQSILTVVLIVFGIVRIIYHPKNGNKKNNEKEENKD